MRILGLFNSYFLILMIFEGLILDLVDSKRLKDSNDKSNMGKKTSHIGKGIILVGILLFLLRVVIRR